MSKFSFQFAQMILTVKSSILVRMESAVSYLCNIRIYDLFCYKYIYFLYKRLTISYHIHYIIVQNAWTKDNVEDLQQKKLAQTQQTQED